MGLAIVAALAFIGLCLFMVAYMLAAALFMSMAETFEAIDRALKALFNHKRRP
jgi:hypothetical protein